jgi:hypothetical protein
MNISAAEAASVVTPALVAWQALFRYCGTGVPARSSEIPTNSEPMRVLVNNVDDSNIGRIAIRLLGAKNACLQGVGSRLPQSSKSPKPDPTRPSKGSGFEPKVKAHSEFRALGLGPQLEGGGAPRAPPTTK